MHNMPLEWTGRLKILAPLYACGLPLRGSVTTSENVSRAADMMKQANKTRQSVL